jgi:Family of unknown function (DUF6444)
VDTAATERTPLADVPVAELVARIECQAAKGEPIAVLTAKVEALTLLVAELSGKLGGSSRNSSKPPSSDGPGTRAERRTAARGNKKRNEPAEGLRPRRSSAGK